MQPPNAWTAVVRGAVLRNLEGSIVSQRRSRYNYGIRVNQPFIPAIHPASSRYWDDLQELYCASKTMQWYVKKDTEVNENRVISIPCGHDWQGHIHPTDQKLRNKISLYANVASTAPVMYDAANSKLVCTMHADLTSVPRENFVKTTNSKGRKYLTLSFNLNVCIDSAHLAFSLEVGGNSYGSVKAVFNR